ncbi:MAG: hypothetical protein WCF95_06695 [bacterium]
MANLLTRVAFVTFATVAPVVVNAQKVAKKVAKKVPATAYAIPGDTLAKEKPMTYYSTIMANQPAPKLSYTQELAKSKYSPIIAEDQNLELTSAYIYHQADTSIHTGKTTTSIEPYFTIPKLVAFKYSPPRFNRTTRGWENRHFTERGSKDILHIDQGVGLRFSDDTTGGGRTKFLFRTQAETGALVRVGGDKFHNQPAFKVTLVDDFKGKFQGVFHKNYCGTKVPIKDKFIYTNFAGVNLTGSLPSGRAKASVAGGFFSEHGKPIQPALIANVRAYLDEGRRMFFFGEGQFVKGGNHQNEFRFGAGGRFGKN